MTSTQRKCFLSKYYLLALLLYCSGLAVGQSALLSAVDIANRHFQQSEYSEAVNDYESILSEYNIHDKKLYYNLGTAYLKLDEKSKAILYLERAKLLAPNNSDINENLNIAYHLTDDDFTVIPDFFLKRWVLRVAATFNSSNWAFLSIILLFVGIGSILYWMFSNNYKIKKRTFVIGISIILLALSTVILGYVKHQRELNNPFAIVMPKSVTLRIAPDQLSREIFPIHEGLKVKILDEIGEWSKIELSNKEVGWVHSADLEVI